MTGKLLASFIVLSSLIMGVSIYYLQVYAYYEEVTPEMSGGVMLLPLDSDTSKAIEFTEFQGINGTSSPIRYRACFQLSETVEQLKAQYQAYPQAEPLTAPGWFECYDSRRVGAALETGEAMAFLSQHEVADGVDRVIAVFPDGQAYAWHQLNEKYAE